MDLVKRSLNRRVFDDGTDRWEIIDARPHETIAPFVKRYSWWNEETQSFTTRRELAGTTGVFIINLGSDLEIVDARGELHRLRAGDGFVGGIAQGTSLSRSTGEMMGFHVHAPLENLSRLAGVALAELSDGVVALDDLGAGHRSIGERLLDAGSSEAGWSVLDEFVGDRLRSTAPRDPMTCFILSRLAKGQRVQSLVAEIGWSRRRLARHVQAEVGLEPRAFAGLARFERFANIMQAMPTLSLAEAALDAGYADQAHLTREVGRYAEMTPRELRNRLLPDAGGVRE
ncbi:AraC-like DNA-binding protein [Sphingomonas sp. BE138]|uniref:AraC family transcriptional regulator n=1 Tax=Sphingomonas sp. BE138 TaxID=2817845 RepID=UPI00285BD7F7|nr:helix-turn-helix domain-containing protein [Sphingomonas sp. BE138]MDR6790659.1 AraC-like DNA-binding protein [Sphingomonas sp. BE138]